MIAPARTRNFDAEMAAAIRAAIPNWDFVPSVVAAQLVEQLWRDDPDLLTGWLEAQAASIIAAQISELTRHDRSRQRRHAKVGAFASAARQTEDGDRRAMSAFLVVHEVDVEHTRRHVRDMTGRDHTFVADRYSESSERAQLLSAFHRAVAREVGERKTSDVLDEEHYAALYRSLVGEPSP